MKPSNQRGTALIFALIFVLVLSVAGASMMFLSQSETWSSMNYRMMTQARYGAEAGLNASANYLINKYTSPGTAADPLTAYKYNGVSPVTDLANNVIYLSSLSSQPSNYPVGAVQTAYSSASSGALTANNSTVNYASSAQLVSMQQIKHCGTGVPLTAQVWRITSDGTLVGVRNATVEVAATLETQITPCYNYAAFATSTACGSINWSGGGTINSYDSATASGGTVTTQAYDGNLGSNGNVNTAPGTIINGTFSSPKTGVGACSSGAALTGALAQVTGCETSTTGCGAPLVTLSQTVVYPNPVIPTTVPTPVSAATSGSLSACGVTCPGTTGNYGDISLSGNGAGSQLVLNPYVDPVTKICSTGTYYINSITMTGANTGITIAPCPGTSPPVYQPVIVNIVGYNTAAPITLTGNSITNPSLDASMLQIQYSGTGAIKLAGNSQAAAVIYAPNAPVTLSGSNTAWYGSIIGSTVQMNGSGVALNYDRRLAKNLFTVSNWTLDSFTWSKY
ncbi:MAG: hypothetical protein PVS2B2_08600 [Candidatus Acidiferrum sp.]